MYVTQYIYKAMWVGYGEIEVVVLKDKIVRVRGAGPTQTLLDKMWYDVRKRADIRDEVIVYAS